MRWLRLALGLAASAQGISQKDMLLSLAGLVLAFMAIADVGCCGAGGCRVDYSKIKQQNAKQIEYEEVDSGK